MNFPYHFLINRLIIGNEHDIFKLRMEWKTKNSQVELKNVEFLTDMLHCWTDKKAKILIITTSTTEKFTCSH